MRCSELNKTFFFVGFCGFTEYTHASDERGLLEAGRWMGEFCVCCCFGLRWGCVKSSTKCRWYAKDGIWLSIEMQICAIEEIILIKTTQLLCPNGSRAGAIKFHSFRDREDSIKTNNEQNKFQIKLRLPLQCCSWVSVSLSRDKFFSAVETPTHHPTTTRNKKRSKQKQNFMVK